MLTKEVADIVAKFGIESALLERIRVGDISDPELRALWRRAKDSIYEIEEFLERES
jgi:hypothetical protein